MRKYCYGVGRTMFCHQAVKNISGQDVIKSLESKGIIVKSWSLKVVKLKPLAVVKGE